MLEIVRSLAPEGLNLMMAENGSQEECMAKIPDADYLFAGHSVQVDAPLLAAGKKLKMVQRFGVGTDSVDQEAMKKYGIPLYINQGVNARSVAELTVLLMLASVRQLLVLDAGMRAREWDTEGINRHLIHGKTVGMIGFGHVGAMVGELLRPFEVKLLYWQPEKWPDEEDAKHNVVFRELDDLLKDSDIVSVHCMMTEENRGMFNKELFAKMKDGAKLINTSRGGLINENDFAEAIKSGKLSGGALDVFSIEPLPDDSPLRDLPNVILTPHAGGVTYESYLKIITEAFNNIKKFDEGNLDAIADRKIL
jgi:phosphoglycerate dehydrogenase-like enzyme